jgi:RNA polymerase sigma-70 factor (ECF subfamily)
MDAACLATDAPMPATSARCAVDPDLALVEAASAGDTAAFEALYRRHVGRIHGTVLRLVGHDHGRAEELVQDAFVRAWQTLGSFRRQSAFGTWLYRLAVNTALMALRRQAADPVRMLSDEALPDAADRPFCPAEREELERAIAALPPRARIVLVLHDVEGWRHEDIAAELAIAQGTSKAQLHHARQRMRHMLGDSR